MDNSTRRSVGRELWSSLFRLNPAPAPRWPLALPAALAIAVPIIAGTLMGQELWGLQAATGAFTILHVSHVPTIERARMLPLIGLALFSAAALGVLVAPFPALTLVMLLCVAVLAGAGMYGFSLGPPGPLFFVLVFGLSAHVSAHLGSGAGGGYLAAVGSGIVFSFLLAMLPLLLPRNRRVQSRSLRHLFPGPSFRGPAGTLLFRAAGAAIIAVLVGVIVDPERAYWIVGSAVGVVGVAAGARAALTRGVHRLVGTLIGAGVYLALALLVPGGVWLGLILGGLQFAVEVLIVRNYAAALIFITPLVLLLTGAATGSVDALVVAERILDTAIGAAIGAASGVLHIVERRRKNAR